MFVGFVILTMFITKWAAGRTKSAADFYTGGGGITGFQNGLAIAGDYMSAASFLGISAAVMANGYDGLIYSIGFLVGWPIMLFLLAEKLRNLGVRIIEPGSGELASGLTGKGRMAEPEEIIEQVRGLLP